MKTGKDAIEKAEDIKPDLILMDIMLAGEMDGIEAAERIRSLLDVPIIFLTANSNNSLLERAKVGTVRLPSQTFSLRGIAHNN